MTVVQDDLDAVAAIGAVPVILDVVCRTTGMGFAAIARVTETRWTACAVRDTIGIGLVPGSELPSETTICHQVRGSNEGVVIDHAAADPVFRNHRTPALYGFQSYVSMPIRLPDGSFFGTLFAIDRAPRALDNASVVGMFRVFADMIGQQLGANRRLRDADADLSRARRDAELREQFIAVLGHDLRNPLACIAAAGHAVARTPVSEEALLYLGLLQSSVRRMAGLIDNVVDFAHGRLGAGLPLERQDAAPLAPQLQQVVDELRAAYPERVVLFDPAPLPPIDCDPGRIAQLLSNLVGNALLHGAPDRPVRVRAVVADGAFTLSVANGGDPIPAAVQQELFQPFFRAGLRRQEQRGLGLGLYIAAEVARAHGGRLEVESGPVETRFTFTLPLGAVAAQARSASSSKLSG